MEIKTDLLKKYVSDYINHNIEDFFINADEIADTVAIKVLAEIQAIIKNSDYSDFDVIEKIVCIFERYKIDFGNRHNF